MWVQSLLACLVQMILHKESSEAVTNCLAFIRDIQTIMSAQDFNKKKHLVAINSMRLKLKQVTVDSKAFPQQRKQ